MSWPIDFADLGAATDPEEANHRNYLAWKEQHHRRRWQSVTLFNIYQCRSVQRMCSQARYKDEAQRESEALKDVVERRISNACDCSTCESHAPLSPERSQDNQRRNSDVSTLSRASTRAGSDVSLNKISSGPVSPTRAMAVPSSKNSLIVSPPPRSRQHRKRANSIPPSKDSP